MTTHRTANRLLSGSLATVYRDHLQNIAAKADIRINGCQLWDMQVHDERTYKRIRLQGSIMRVGRSFLICIMSDFSDCGIVTC